mmetsp:Transcript_101697/g.283131  ORF Transcript_101697/g.283131 Transcript_101697/m.283131 type:complete len:385 (-) Transcript_101697:287-1441(-)
MATHAFCPCGTLRAAGAHEGAEHRLHEEALQGGILQDAHGPGAHARHGDARALPLAAAGRRADLTAVHAALDLVRRARRAAVWAVLTALRRRRRGRRRGRGPFALATGGLCSHNGVGGHGHDPALPGATGLTKELEVAILTPVRAPGVPQQPVGRALLRSIPNHKHTMIRLGAAAVCVNTGLVEVEGDVLRFDAHRHGLLSHGFHQRCLVLLCHVAVATHDALGQAHGALGARGPALAQAPQVGVALRCTQRRPLGVHERGVHVATEAPLGPLARAVHQLLLTQDDENASLDLPGGGKRGRGRKGPASAAMALVPNRRQSPARPPVHRSWQGCGSAAGRRCAKEGQLAPQPSVVRPLQAQAQGHHLRVRAVREAVEAKLEGVVP